MNNYSKHSIQTLIALSSTKFPVLFHKLLHLPVIKLLPAIQSSEAKTLLMNVMLSEKNGQNVTRTIFVKLLLIICFKLPI